MAIDLAYGSTGLTVHLPAERTTVVAPVHRDADPDPDRVLREALSKPVSGRSAARHRQIRSTHCRIDVRPHSACNPAN